MTYLRGNNVRRPAGIGLAVVLLVACGPAALGLGSVAGAAAAAGTRGLCVANPLTPTHIGRFLGIVPARAESSAHCVASPARPGAPGGRGAGASNQSSPYSGTPPLLYSGGPIMSTTGVGSQVTLTPIYWGSSSSFASTYESVINQFVGDVAHDSGLSTNVFSVLTQYTDSSADHVHYKIVAGSAISDTNAYPSNGCTPDSGLIYADHTGYTACLTDAQLQTELQTEITTHSLPTDLGHMYLLFLPEGIENCFHSLDGAQGGQCTINYSSGTAGGFCAYHSSFDSGRAIYASMPFPVYQSSTGYTCGPDGGPGIQSLNGNVPADVEVSPLSHETAEAMTDPLGSAWYDSSGNEIGDDCAYVYGPVSGSSGSEYNQTINGHHYLIQEEFSNEDYVAGTAGCIQHEELPTASIGASPTAPKIGQSVGFSGTGSRDGDHSGGKITSYSWNFGDGSNLVTDTASSLHAYSLSGTYHATLQVTDVDGWVSAPASVTITVGGGFSVTGMSPSSVGQGASAVPVTISGSGFESGATVSDSNSGVTFSSVVVQSSTSITAVVSISAAATSGATNVTVSQAVLASATCTSCLMVTTGPSVSKVAPNAVAQGTSQTVQVSGTSFQSGAVVSLSGTGVTASVGTVNSGSLSVKLTISSTAAPGARDVTVTNPDGGTTKCTGCLTVVLQRITNGGFEAGNLSGWRRSGTTRVTTSGPHTGTYSALLGATTATRGNSSISQTFGVPSKDSAVSFYYEVSCRDKVTNDWATAVVTNHTTGVTSTVLPKTCPRTTAWKQAKAWLIPGDVYTLTITNHDDGVAASPTYTKVDNVALAVAPMLTNGGFETGTLSHWKHGGTAAVTTSRPHSGKYAALLGAAKATRGVSSLLQTFTVASRSTTLSFWYDVTCPDTVTHDWATATLKDMVTGKTVTLLAKTCVASSGWIKVTAPVVAGHSYTLRLVNRDDDVAANPTFTKYDDVTLS